ncbi:Molybdopterin synthase catalytic subunit [Seminavis robusta]|uniref:Molybdopterin synthase catalytic subunit n=1 Tax=Seminavis robusta TaxID=568900 RepID=A0A9N8D6N3_9STRA|nr:Molybdopterin synthase catalytic subunit [Seminavis robusta]|eukprot:Sro14_g010490.1 Molybdopterin synthase catalytic subunit (179) ;mRNA; r:62673-63209
MTTTENNNNNPSNTTATTATDNNNDDNEAFMIQVTENLPSLEDCYNFVVTGTSGAVSTFVGITRDNYQGKQVAKLSYEGYVPMAVKELRKLCRDARTKYSSIDKIAAVHILGDCPVGQASVILAASSPHRRDAMHCTEYLIDELKRRIPIWKREVYEGDLGSVWKENAETRQMERFDV